MQFLDCVTLRLCNSKIILDLPNIHFKFLRSKLIMLSKIEFRSKVAPHYDVQLIFINVV